MSTVEFLDPDELRPTGLNAGLRAWQAERRANRAEHIALSQEQEILYGAIWKRQRAEVKRKKAAASKTASRAQRRAAQLQRTPPWADMAVIREFYETAARMTQALGQPYHVDHVIPLQGKLVSGLHVHNNLQILTGPENSKKRNRFEVDL